MVYYMVIIINYNFINDKINKMKFYKKNGNFFQRKGIIYAFPKISKAYISNFFSAIKSQWRDFNKNDLENTVVFQQV